MDINGLVDNASGGDQMSSIINLIYGNKATKELQHAVDKASGEVNAGYDKAAAYYDPYLQQGNAAYKTLGELLNSGSFNTEAGNFNSPDYQGPKDFSYGKYQDKAFNFQEDPGYNFRKQGGQNTIESSAAARGSQLSGATLKALTKYGQDFASNEYQNAFNRYNTDRNYNRTNYNTDRSFAFGNYLNNRQNYNTDRSFNYGVFNDDYNRRRTSNLDRYGQLNDMAQSGINAGNSLAGLAARRGETNGNLSIQKGNIGAANQQMKGGEIGGGFTTSSGSQNGVSMNDISTIANMFGGNSGNSNNGNSGSSYNYGNVGGAGAQEGVDYNYGGTTNSSGGNNSTDQGGEGEIMSLLAML